MRCLDCGSDLFGTKTSQISLEQNDVTPSDISTISKFECIFCRDKPENSELGIRYAPEICEEIGWPLSSKFSIPSKRPILYELFCQDCNNPLYGIEDDELIPDIEGMQGKSMFIFIKFECINCRKVVEYSDMAIKYSPDLREKLGWPLIKRSKLQTYSYGRKPFRADIHPEIAYTVMRDRWRDSQTSFEKDRLQEIFTSLETKQRAPQVIRALEISSSHSKQTHHIETSSTNVFPITDNIYEKSSKIAWAAINSESNEVRTRPAEIVESKKVETRPPLIPLWKQVEAYMQRKNWLPTDLLNSTRKLSLFIRRNWSKPYIAYIHGFGGKYGLEREWLSSTILAEDFDVGDVIEIGGITEKNQARRIYYRVSNGFFIPFIQIWK